VIAEFGADLLRSDSAGRQRLLNDLNERLNRNPFDELIADEALFVLKRRLGSDADRQQLFASMEKLAPECAFAIQFFVAAARAQEKFSRTERLVGTRDFKVTGTLVDGSSFDSGSLEGKVVVVDFWATWCGPCVAELPRLAQLREKHQAEGLEIVGINNDKDLEAVQAFLENRTDISWPQLFDAASAANSEMHELTRNSGVQAIPALFVIDRHGVLRTVSARETLEETVTALLKEPTASEQP
jgi:thiol-disulfide isomerase/thioredoxin